MAIESAILTEYAAVISTGYPMESKSPRAETERITLANSINYGPCSGPDGTGKLLAQIKARAITLLNGTWHKRQVRWVQNDWDVLEGQSKGYNTHALMISCGTVTIDRAAFGDRRVLLIWNKNTKAWQLPKGRKNVHEDLAAAAFRETTEETGVAVRPLYLRFRTRFTLPDDGQEGVAKKLRQRLGDSLNDRRLNESGIANLLNKDTFYFSQYPDPATGAMRHIYWYAARPERGTVSDVTLMGKEDAQVMRAQWFPAGEAVDRLKMSVERDAVALAVHYAEQMTDEEWRYSFDLE
ncbi:hypothetical protein JX265_012507 [Neoarthrinium moseri]|uniref:Nudix hydrolase domain-containing protein n=1 Tax=Neoarthrinium moseri TaxID=1658444 RepID=A0A9Q0AIG6_9PEZI|nr:hypothetical protein JX265_012507 [Neoarthrinium moseri]